MTQNKLDSAESRQVAELERITSQLDRIIAADIKRLPESVFVATFLPFFSGEPVDEDKINISVWGGIAGNPYMPVDIVEDKTGVVLYQVPPLFDREAIDPSKRDPNLAPLHHAILTAEQLSRGTSPIRGRNYLNHQLSQRNLLNDDKGHVVANVQAWNVIFARYNKPLLPMPGETVPPPALEATNGKGEEKAQLRHEDDDLL